ncbi:MAG: nucleotidyltransferase domain-containing protein [Coriobacteriales bacterium]|jgi:predicted nucleotidyltransferase|nr:nucleotidyltransferase domain-containing protein [Coriobacteriales bacterium]
MRDAIQNKLLEIEEAEKVRIVYCAESGSRAWGFASADSDYDVRFVYARELHEYLRLDLVRDVIEWENDGVFDISGWDLQKALRLLRNSNPTFFEWGSSPLIYRETPEWDAVRAAMGGFFRARPGAFHYLNMAGSNYRKYLRGESVGLKKYLCALRPILACRWILDHGTPPPMPFAELVEAELEPEVLPVVAQLLEWKASAPEAKKGPQIEVLNAYIEKSLTGLEEALSALPTEPKPGWDSLNSLFLSLVMRDGIL